MKDWKVWFVGGVAAAGALYAFGLFYEGFVSDHASSLLTYPFVDKAAAERAYDRLGPKSSLAERRYAADQLIRADPTNPQSWMAQSIADWMEHGRHLSPAGVTDLDHSYAVSFFAREIAVGRVRFALENWGSLPEALRSDVTTEAHVCLKDPYLRAEMIAQIRAVQSPEGHFSGALLVAGSPP